jgi:hypothetical protein
MLKEINPDDFTESNFYKGIDQEHLKWVNSIIDFINTNYLWKPVVIHVNTPFLEYVHHETNRRELPPYYGILNPCDEKGNFVLFPWIRTQDRWAIGSQIISRSEGIDGVMNGLVGLLDPANVISRCDHKLIIPRSELWAVHRDPDDKTYIR